MLRTGQRTIRSAACPFPGFGCYNNQHPNAGCCTQQWQQRQGQQGLQLLQQLQHRRDGGTFNSEEHHHSFVTAPIIASFSAEESRTAGDSTNDSSVLARLLRYYDKSVSQRHGENDFGDVGMDRAEPTSIPG